MESTRSKRRRSKGIIRLAAASILACSSQSPASPPGDAEAARIATRALQRLPKPHSDAVKVLTFAEDERHAAPPGPGITLVVGDSRTSTAFVDVSGNCKAFSKVRQIRCDLLLIDDLLKEFRLVEDADTVELLFAIILSHELGHIAFEHSGAAYHDDGGTISVLSYAGHKAELEADAFSVELLDQTSKPVEEVYRFIETLARTAQHRSLCPEVFPKACPCPPSEDFPGCSTLPVGPGLPNPYRDTVKVRLQGTHPGYVIRFIRMLHLSSAPRMRDIYTKDALFNLQRMVVLDRAGVEQSIEPMFRDPGAQERTLKQARRLVRKGPVSAVPRQRLKRLRRQTMNSDQR